jgi:hypothetical protein
LPKIIPVINTLAYWAIRKLFTKNCYNSISIKTKEKFLTSGLYYKHVTIVNYASSGVNRLKASVNDDARVVIYDHRMFIVQATVFGF